MDTNTQTPVRVIDMRDAVKATRILGLAHGYPFNGDGPYARLSEWSLKGEIPARKANVLYLVDEDTAWYITKAHPSRDDIVCCFSQEFHEKLNY